MANPYNKYIKQYQTNNITTATPEKLMIMLFDGAIQFLQKAKSAIEEKNIKEQFKHIIHTEVNRILNLCMKKLSLDITVCDSWFRPSKESTEYASYYEEEDGYEYFMGDQLIIDEALYTNHPRLLYQLAFIIKPNANQEELQSIIEQSQLIQVK